VAGAQHAAGCHRKERRLTSGDDVEALMGTAAAARDAELADVAAGPVRPGDREDVGVELGGAVARGTGGRRRDENGECEEDEEERALQWCSMTRSTMLYSFASAALMK
jgi:hypothetical protein